MPGYFALLRAINVGGKSVLKMGALRGAFEDLGFTEVETFLASGNIYFETRSAGTRTLERKIDSALEKAFRRPMLTFVRTVAEMAAVAAYNPYGKSALRSADINIVFLGAKPGPPALRRLKALKTRTDEFRAHGRQVYWLRRRLPGGPDYASIPLDKALGAMYTVRGLRTVQKMTAKHPPKHG